MNTLVISGILSSVRAVLAYLTARRANQPGAAVEIIKAIDLSPFGLDSEELQLALYAKAGLNYLTTRGVLVDEVIDLIALAESEGTDISAETVKTHLDLTQTELDETQALIDAMQG